MTEYLSPAPLERDHDLAGFRSDLPAQGDWLRRRGRQSHSSRDTTVMVSIERGTQRVAGYYAWRMSDVAPSDAPARLLQGAGGYDVPAALLARLAVDERDAGRGLGSSLLRDVVFRTIEASATIGCRALVVHCADEHARKFYLDKVPSFEPSPSDPLHLVLLVKDMRRTLGISSS